MKTMRIHNGNNNAYVFSKKPTEKRTLSVNIVLQKVQYA